MFFNRERSRSCAMRSVRFIPILQNASSAACLDHGGKADAETRRTRAEEVYSNRTPKPSRHFGRSEQQCGRVMAVATDSHRASRSADIYPLSQASCMVHDVYHSRAHWWFEIFQVELCRARQTAETQCHMTDAKHGLCRTTYVARAPAPG
jgi:hypothetical protein